MARSLAPSSDVHPDPAQIPGRDPSRRRVSRPPSEAELAVVKADRWEKVIADRFADFCSRRDPEAILRVFHILKDADALDRVRLGRGDLDVSWLRHEFSLTRVDRAWELLREVG